MILRSFQPGDAGAVSALVVHTLRTANRPDYSEEYIERIAARHTPAGILSRAAQTHFYVACEGEEILGCGAVAPVKDREDECCLYTVFVRTDRQGSGIGRALLAALETDEYARRSRRILVPASITGVPFYLRLGYNLQPGVAGPDEDGLLPMEKWL